jgi:hypothetical protein
MTRPYYSQRKGEVVVIATKLFRNSPVDSYCASKMTKITHKASSVMFTARMAQRQAFEPNACDEE